MHLLGVYTVLAVFLLAGHELGVKGAMKMPTDLADVRSLQFSIHSFGGWFERFFQRRLEEQKAYIILHRS